MRRFCSINDNDGYIDTSKIRQAHVCNTPTVAREDSAADGQ